MSVVPDEIVETVRRAATAASAHGGDLGSVRHRAVRRRRRRQATVATCAAALVAIAAAAVPAALDRTPAEPAAAAEPAQRLLVRAAGLALQSKNGPEVGIVNERELGEVLPDGSLVRHAIPGVDDWLHAVGLPDGRLVVLGYTEHTPGTPRISPNAAAEGVSIDLEVLAADGTIELSRDVGVKDEITRLVGADETTAYLLRPRGLMAHDLATGAERLALALSAFGSVGPRVDVGNGVVVLLDGCELRVFVIPGNRSQAQATVPCALAETPPQGPDLRRAQDVRLSPDGRLVAVPYYAGDELRLAVVDTRTGATRATETLDIGPSRFQDVYGLAWTDNRSVRVAWAALPPDAARLYRLDEILRTETITIP
ncbi:hypothetical protein WEI85_08215 [Actinomycetes bacterium KLBMP 9797]